MKKLIILSALLVSFTSSANTEVTNEIASLDATVENSIILDKRKRKARKRRRKNKHRGCFNSRQKWDKKYYMS